MEAYLVRLKPSEQHAREIVGIFVAEDMEELYWMVDECAPPPDCECLVLGSGAIYWERFTGHRVPRETEPDWETTPEDWSPLPDQASLTDTWDKALSADGFAADDAWEPITWSNEEGSGDATQMLPRLPPRGRQRRRRI